MDDLEFRRTVYADPNTSDPQVQQSAAGDPSKQAFLSEMQAFEKDLEAAFKVPVPENLSERIILGQALHSHKQSKRRTQAYVAMAASIAFAVGLSARIFYAPFSEANIGTYSLAHVNHGIYHLQNAHEQDTVDELNLKLARFGGRFSEGMGTAVFANYCDFEGVTSLHLIFESDSGRVSVFITPSDVGLPLVRDFGDDRFVGRVISFDKADVVVVGDKGKPLMPFIKKVEKNLTWEI